MSYVAQGWLPGFRQMSSVQLKVSYGRARLGGLVHLIEYAGSALEADRIIFAARWKCGDASSNVALLAGAEIPTCARCAEILAGPVVYRCFAGDHLLYVGSTATRHTRLVTHSKKSPWWPRVTRTEFEDFKSMLEARSAEVAAIRAEKPSINRQLQDRAVA